MTSSGRRLGVVLGLVFGTFAFGGLLSLLISSFRGEVELGTWDRFFVGSLLVGMTAWGIVRAVQWATRGATLHRFGPEPKGLESHARRTNVLAWFWVVLGMVVLFDGVTRPDPGDVRGGLIYIILGAWLRVMVAALPPEIAERGLWLTGFIRWRRIRSFRWKDGSDDLLVLRVRSRLGGERDTELRIAEDDRASIESILVERGVARAEADAA